MLAYTSFPTSSLFFQPYFRRIFFTLSRKLAEFSISRVNSANPTTAEMF